MIAYTDTIDNKIWKYFFDTNIRLWTIFPIDADGFEIPETSPDYFTNKTQMSRIYPGLTFKNKID